MAFANNVNYTSAINPIDVGQPTKVVPPDIANGFKPEGPVAAEHLNYCLDRLETTITVFTTVGATVWNAPPGLVAVKILLIGGGAGGANGASGVGGAGGSAAEPVQAVFSAAMIGSSLTVTVGAGGAAATTGAPTHVSSGGATLLWSAGGGSVDVGSWPADVISKNVLSAVNDVRTQGGAGGTAAVGLRGYHSGFGPGGAGGAVGVRGTNGFGYGAGGGGYGLTQPDGAGGGTLTAGLPGARGFCMITAWREIS